MNIVLNAMEKNKKHRWKGGGHGSMAVMLGFKRPDDKDNSGMWEHPHIGSFYDDTMPAIVAATLKNYFTYCKADDMVLTVSRINTMLQPMVATLEDEWFSDEHGPIEAKDHVEEIITMLKGTMELCQQLLVDEGLR